MYNDGVGAKGRNCTVKEKRLTTMTEAVTTTTTMEEVECCECIEPDLFLLSMALGASSYYLFMNTHMSELNATAEICV